MTSFHGWTDLLGRVSAGEELEPSEAGAAISEILAGDATPAQIAGFVMAIKTRGERPAEIAGMVEAMLAAAEPLRLPAGAIDIVGTGGSAPRRTAALNVSTMACFVAAGAGAVVCKHGNRKATSTSGSTDLLDALGISVETDGEALGRCVEEVGVGFAFAKLFHPAMRFAGPVRAELGVPTLFNLLGPLSHPGRIDRQVIGVARPELGGLVADALAVRGEEGRHLVVHGSDGLDELTLSGSSSVWSVEGGAVQRSTIHPSDVGLDVVAPGELPGGDADENAAIARSVFAGEGGPASDIVAFNAGAGLVVAGRADDLAQGVAQAQAAIADGRAEERLEALIGHQQSV